MTYNINEIGLWEPVAVALNSNGEIEWDYTLRARMAYKEEE